MKRAPALLVLFALAGCAPATTAGGGQPEGPAPEPEPTTPPGVAEPTGTIYRPVRNAAYVLERHDSLALQLPGGASQQQLINRTAYLSVTLVPDTGGYQATIVLDSLLASDGAVPAMLDSLVPAWGTRWSGKLSADGRLSPLVADRSTTLGDQVGANLRSLFPTLPPGGVRAGMTWADTTDVPVRAGAFDAMERGITSYRATDSDDPQSRNAIALESSGTYQRTGKQMQFDQQRDMTATGTRSAVHQLSRDGILISGRGTDEGEMTITIPDLGQTVPVKQTGTFSIMPLNRSTR